MVDLQPNEKIIIAVRKHWFVFFLEVIVLILAALAPFALLPFASSVFPTLEMVQISAATIAFFVAVWLIFVWIIFFVIWTDYYLDVLIVTSRRIVDVEQRGLFARDIATSPLGNIQDIKIEIRGIVPTILNYGNLHIQTAGTSREIVIEGIRDPRGIKKIITGAYYTQKNAARAPYKQ